GSADGTRSADGRGQGLLLRLAPGGRDEPRPERGGPAPAGRPPAGARGPGRPLLAPLPAAAAARAAAGDRAHPDPGAEGAPAGRLGLLPAHLPAGIRGTRHVPLPGEHPRPAPPGGAAAEGPRPVLHAAVHPDRPGGAAATGDPAGPPRLARPGARALRAAGRSR